MWFLIIVILHLLGALSAVKAVMETRTSQGAIGWVIFLITFPYISLPIYWLLGRKRFHGYISAMQVKDGKTQKTLKRFHEESERYKVPLDMMSKAAAGEKLAHVPTLRGNSVKLLIDGDATFDSIINGISSAKSYVLFQFFIIKDDDIGQRIKEALTAKAREGVPIYMLYDEVGSHNLPKAYINALREEGIKIYAFHTQKGLINRFQLNFRNHRKVVVVDGRYAWIGGHNVGDEYLGKSPKFGHWRDTHVKIEGPAVLVAQLSFAEDWHWATNQTLADINWIASTAPESDQKVLIIRSGPADQMETASLMFHHAINMAQKRIWIASPYFVPDDAILSALQLAGLRGVDVRILIPDKPDHLLVFLAAYTYFEDVVQTGVRFFRYTDGFLHQKVMLIDEDTATVGTANLDNRSIRLNFEITGIVKDPDFASQIEAMLLNDMEHSREMTEDELKSMSFWFKLATRLARLTSPIQ